MRVLNTEQMVAFDRWAIEELGLPAEVLMENAALGVVDALMENAGSAKSFCIVCGPGNNGADGYAVARQLLTRGFLTLCIQVGPVRSGSSLDLQQRVFAALGGQVDNRIPEASMMAEFSVVIDALFGTGLSRPLEGDAAQAVNAINACSSYVACIDLPSGLFASTGSIPGLNQGMAGQRSEETVENGKNVVKGDLTVSFSRPKIAHVAFPASAYCGDVVIADLGVDYRDRGHGPWQNAIDAASVNLLLRPRYEAAHKGTYGTAMVVAGSAGMVGAALLATSGALRSGAGLVKLFVPGFLGGVALEVPEAMTTAVGAVDTRRFSEEDLETVRTATVGCSSLTIGPGLGRSPESLSFCRQLLAGSSLRAVVDADGLRAFDELEAARSSTPRVLTPHPGELAFLMDCSVDSIESDRLGAAREASRRAGSVVVLKGRSTVVAEPDGEAWINTSGGPLLASGGSGDVLAGIIGALLAQGYSALDSALIGTFVHGLAADRLTEGRSRVGLGARAIAQEVPAAFEACYRFSGG